MEQGFVGGLERLGMKEVVPQRGVRLAAGFTEGAGHGGEQLVGWMVRTAAWSGQCSSQS